MYTKKVGKVLAKRNQIVYNRVNKIIIYNGGI